MWKFEGSEPYVVDLVRWHVFQETSQSESKAEALSRKRKKAKQSKQATVAWDHRKYYWCAKQKSEISSWTCVRTFIEPKYTIRTSVLTWSISIPYFTGQHIFQRISEFKAGNRWLGPVKNIKISHSKSYIISHQHPTAALIWAAHKTTEVQLNVKIAQYECYNTKRKKFALCNISFSKICCRFFGALAFSNDWTE